MPSKMRSSSVKKRRPASRPAFDGAPFDAHGGCLYHESVQLAEQVKQDGRLLWREIRASCPKCAAEHHRSRRVTSLGGAGKVKRGRTVHGKPNPLRDLSRGRHMDKQFDTPFDDKGRCHHHPNIQMATKKSRGGWKILMESCPRCIEAKFEEASVASWGSSRAGGSVASRSTKRSVTSRTKAASSGAKFDKNGCCTRHPTVQIAKKKILGGWKEYRTCPKCVDPHNDDMADNASVSSKTSRKSTTSFRSHGTAKSGRSRKSMRKGDGSRKGGGKTDRYGALPFDGEGYCYAHPGIRLAKKKALGGWKVLHDICPECAADATSAVGLARSRSSRRSAGTGRFLDGSGSVTSGGSGRSGASRKKKIRVKDMRYQDEDGREGRYSGEVDEDHQPHGQGKMKYKDVGRFEGVWKDGSKVHGKTTKAKSSSKSSSKPSSGEVKSGGEGKPSSNDWARRDSGRSGGRSDGGSGRDEGGGGPRKTVNKMKWMDWYGDPGEYTGEVDADRMPHGRGSMKYDHGLIQEGMWTGGQFVEGSDVNLDRDQGEGRRGGRLSKPKKSGRSGGGRRESLSREVPSVRGLEP